MKRNICDLHDEIYDLAKQINNLKVRNYETIEDALADTQSMADDILTLAVNAKDAGIRMENRLSEYKSAIESLGFYRINHR
jgi:hypothetical protein